MRFLCNQHTPESMQIFRTCDCVPCRTNTVMWKRCSDVYRLHRRSISGVKHPHTVLTTNSLASLYRSQGQYGMDGWTHDRSLPVPTIGLLKPCSQPPESECQSCCSKWPQGIMKWSVTLSLGLTWRSSTQLRLGYCRLSYGALLHAISILLSAPF
jgi:hypothetical protein